nr:heparinase II/III family protein [Pararhizobium haloflavum]
MTAFRFSGMAPDRLIVAPTDLRIADRHIAEEIYAGRFPLAGQVFDTFGASPFISDLPSEEFAERLHSFRWLRHLRAANHELAFANGRALVDEWISVHGRRMTGIGWRPDIIAERTIAWLSHSPIVLKGADHGFYRRFLRSLALQIRYLRHIAPTTIDGEVRLRVRIALAMATLAMPASPSTIRSAARNLDHEMDRQILPDGGHVSRNPQVILDLLADLLPLRQTYINLGQSLPKRLIPGIDRMFPALRFFRHSNGELALFNGATAVSADRLLCVLRYDESTGRTFRAAPHMHYHRLECSQTVVIADTGRPPPGVLSQRAHAGCLSFEMSSGRNRYVVNAGVPVAAASQFGALSRSTAAHSGLILNDTSSARQSQSHFLGPIIVGGIRSVTSQRIDSDEGAQGFSARHDGYLSRFGLIHEREIRLNAEGDRITGRDRLLRTGDKDPKAEDASLAIVRFHIHPKISVGQTSDGAILLTAADGEKWLFSSIDARPAIEESIFLADLTGPRKTRQITLSFTVGSCPEIQWQLIRRPE